MGEREREREKGREREREKGREVSKVSSVNESNTPGVPCLTDGHFGNQI